MFQRCDCAESFNLRSGLGDGPSDAPLFIATGYDEYGRPIAVDAAGNTFINTGGNDVSGGANWEPAPQTDFLVRETAANYFDAEPEFGFTPDARPVTYATPTPAPAPGGGSVIGNLIQQMQQMEAPSLAPSGSVAPSIAPAPSLPPAPAPSAGAGSTGGGGGGVIVAPGAPLAPFTPAPSPAPRPAPVVWDEVAGEWTPAGGGGGGGGVSFPGAAGEQITQAAGVGRFIALALLALPFFER